MKSKVNTKQKETVSLFVSELFIATLFNKSRRIIKSWVSDSGLPKLPDGKFDLSVVVEWREKRIRDDFYSRTPDDARLIKAQADEREEKAAIAKMKRQVQEGELLPLVDVERGRIERIIAMKTALQALSITLSKQLIGEADEFEIEKIVAREVYQVLERFAENKDLTAAAELVSAPLVSAIIDRLSDGGLVAKGKLGGVEFIVSEVLMSGLMGDF